MPGAVLYAPQASVTVAARVCSSGEGKGRVGEKGILAGNVVGVCAGRERPEGKMPDRWRNAEGGCGGVLRSPGGRSLCRYVRCFVMERTEAFLKERKEGIQGVSANRKDRV